MKKKKRRLFDELMSGIEEIKQYKQGEIVLHNYTKQEKLPIEVAPEFIVQTREGLGMSQGVFAKRLRVSASTLKNWEKGRTKPNHQAVALIVMTRQYPDTMDRLAHLESM